MKILVWLQISAQLNLADSRDDLRTIVCDLAGWLGRESTGCLLVVLKQDRSSHRSWFVWMRASLLRQGPNREGGAHSEWNDCQREPQLEREGVVGVDVCFDLVPRHEIRWVLIWWNSDPLPPRTVMKSRPALNSRSQ